MSTKRKQNKPNRRPEDDNKADTEGQQFPAAASEMSSTKEETSRDEDKKEVCAVKSHGLVEKENEGLVGKLEEGDDDDDNAMISEEEGEDEELMGDDARGNEDNGKETFELREVPRYEDVEEPPLLEDDHPAKVHSREGSPEKDSDDSPELEKESLTAALQNLMVDFHWPEGTSITIERVESTKIAVAELTAAAIQSSTNDYSSASLQDLALIQSTLFTLQQQQIVQLQLVQQLLAQLAMCTGELESMQECSEPSSPTRDHDNSHRERSKSVEKSRENKSTAGETTLSMKFASLLNCGNNQDPNRPLSPGLAAQSSLNAILMPNGGLNEEVNTLEMLQKRAQEVLDSASQGLLASSLADDNYRKSGGVMDKREPFFKHRCRYCGKVFGSDSALQIHIRSHTGERPYKCNICGSRFTTKGNLKVHFQRHTAKFPHVKMNPHPVPEHLDHFHPPLLASGERSPDLIPTNLPFGPVPPNFQPMNFMRFDGPAAAAVAAAKLSLGLQLPRAESIEPEDLSKAKPKKKVEEAKSDIEDKRLDDDDVDDDEDDDDVEMEKAEQPENLSSKSATLMHSIPLQASPRPTRPSSTTSKASRPRRESPSPSSKDGGDRMDETSGLIDITKDPRSYAALLPRPGSASSAWESLIEVNTSSETSKLQQLVDNIDNQISDPNECVVCHRVLSCKSALQMHYRTHTGERPFKCRLCGRAFTTKGNLKTHMGVHRIKEGDTHHQCPVCHKRFTTQLVLQQHIRLHTGEPTELTFDQIRAGEIRDFIPNFAGPAGGGFPLVATPKDSRDSTATPGTPSFSTSLAALENQVRTFTTTFAGSGPSLFPEDLSKKIASGPPTPSVLHPPPSTTSRNSAPSPATTDSELSSSDWGKHSESDTRTTPPSASTPSGQGPPPPFLPLDLTPKNSNIFSPFLPNPLNPLMGNSALSSLASSVLNSTAAFNPMHMSMIAGRGATRGNTTCGLCFKTFACNSALEIHYRSHTKERPFKCTVCDRGFSTKGNMKQHMLTHKIRDMPPNVFDGSKVHNQNSNSSSGSLSVPPTPKSIEEPQKPEMPKEIEREPEVRRKVEHIDEPVEEPRHTGHHDDENSRSSSSGGSKHMCHVCQKGFSSSSSVHIHMRTHTGDKPFKCNVCQKAFTTKGNLKVHMGTHMWTSGASRRGRRMSLELPLGLQFQPPGIGERVDGRNFFPFVPPNFPGGPVNLAASKMVDYSLLRPPMQFSAGVMPGRSSPSVGGIQTKHEDKEDPVTDGGDEDDDALSEA